MQFRPLVALAATAVPWLWAAGCSKLPESAHPTVSGEQLPPAPTATSTGTAVASVAPAASSAPVVVASAPASASASAAADPSKRWTFTGSVTTAANKAASSAVVYLEDGPIEKARGASATIDQKGMLFLPFVSAIRAGGSVTFNNSDPFPHNVYSWDNEKFNLGMISQWVKRTREFPKAGTYRLLCNLHPGMLAYVVVAPSSFFAVTDGKGHFTMKDVPEGTYQVVVWHRDDTKDSQSVTVKGGDATATFTLHK
ncbi:MAG: hypothetical protein HYV09_02950 [Deltaproteobacteria bacterium]|nr:hypothetical protein [Deltaproteobacteria bacterium]